MAVLALGAGLSCGQPATPPGATTSGIGGGAASAGTGGGSGTAGSGTSGSGTAGSGTAGSGTAGSGTAGSGTAGSSNGTAGTEAGGSGGTGASTSADAAVSEATLAYNGSVNVLTVQISAPILPRTTVIYQAFPTTLDGEKTMAHDASLLFDFLLGACAPLYPKITLDPTDAGLTAAELGMNYDQVGLCAYEQYVAKPYWIPKLVDDVDICGTEMGAGWRLITEADLTSLRDADFQAASDVWNHYVSGGQGLAFFFSSLQIWVRANDGSIAVGTLQPGLTGSRVTPLGVPSTSTTHYEGELGLRCIRSAGLP
jgi:hypothetical protein